MVQIYESKNFIIESHERPEIDRLEGGHIKISPKKNYSDMLFGIHNYEL